MSSSIKRARLVAGDPAAARSSVRAMPGIGYVGDPGLFGSIGRLLKGGAKAALSVARRLPGPVGFAAGAVSTAVGAGRQRVPQRPQVMTAPTIRMMQQQGRPMPVLPTPGLRGLGQRLMPGGATGLEVRAPVAAGPPAPGYHLNKSDYFLKDGTFVAKGTVWVKNRRRNPLNPRALDRAIGRVSSAKNASRRLGRITIRKKECA